MLDTWIVLLRDGTASKSGFCTADVFLLIVAKGSPLRERRRVGKKTGRGYKKGQKKGEKWRRKVLLIANRTQAVVSLTVYDVYIYIYICIAPCGRWIPLLHLFFLPSSPSSPSSSPYRLSSFHKKQPSASSWSSRRSVAMTFPFTYVPPPAKPRLAPDKQVVPSVFLHPSMFFLRHHSYANRASSYYPFSF